ncbi:MAG: isoprenyl transferase [Bacteroidales bacterium]|nr:isoprenyl transferase [Bacteroidales bacterium]
MSNKEKLDTTRIPQHVAVIMDGNGRWAALRGKDRLEGHNQGAKSARTVVEAAAEIGVKYITLYAFSMENWNRPKDEVAGLMSLLLHSIASQLDDLIKNNIRLKIIGDTSLLPSDVLSQVNTAVLKSQNNTGLTAVIALSYGSRAEILNATKQLLHDYQKNPFDIDAITEQDFAKRLYTNDIPDPELLIRTSGELRISNFLLWQISYSELYFTDTLWPDFSKEDFFEAIYQYQQRERRFGKTSQQIATLK